MRLPGAGAPAENLRGAAHVGRGAGQGTGDELGPVDRQRRAGVGIRFPFPRTVLAHRLIRQMSSFGQGGDGVVKHLVVRAGNRCLGRGEVTGVEQRR